MTAVPSSGNPPRLGSSRPAPGSSRTSRRSGSVLFLGGLLVALLAPGLLSGQEPGTSAQEADPEPEWPIDPDTHPRPTHPAVRTAGPIVIDGRPDEAAWDAAEPITRFIQSQPRLGHPATQRTEIRFLYDDEYLYISCVCYDSEPDNLTVPSLERDFRAPDSDAVSVVLDPNLDRRNGFLFTVNPYGAVGDAQAFDDHRSLNYAWDGLVHVETERTDFGWTFEMAIPWRTLRFEGSEGSQDWGMNVLRRVRRINEVAYWAPLNRHEFIPRVSRAGTLTGLVGIRQPRNVQLKPFVVGSTGSGPALPEDGNTLDIGADLKYGLTSSLTLDLTYRTDFSHVEADEVQVNLTRFPLFFPERREFFIENSGIFQFGDARQQGIRSSVSPRDFTLFHTRRIGLGPAGEPIPIQGGTRLSGHAGDYEVGFLGMRTEATSAHPGRSFGVLRVRRKLLEDSDVGLLVTHRSARDPQEGEAGTYDRAVGADANFTFFDHLRIASYIAGVDSRDREGDRTAARVSAGWRDRFWNTSVIFRRFGPAFDPGLGFVRRTGVRHTYATLGVHPSVDFLGIQEINPYGEIDHYTNLESVLETRRGTLGLGFDFFDGARLSFTYQNELERLFEPFRVTSGLFIPEGEYRIQEGAVSYATSRARTLSGDVRLSRGGYFDGTRTAVEVGGAWRPTPHLTWELSASRNDISLPRGGLVADVVRTRITVAPSTRFFTNALVQYNGVTDELLTNLRLRFIHSPLSDLYLVYSELRPLESAGEVQRSVSLKFTNLFGF